MMSTASSLSRRQSLALIVKLMVLAAVLVFIWVLLANLGTPQHRRDGEQNKIADYMISENISSLGVGQLQKVTLRHREVWIFHRSQADIANIAQRGDSFRSVKNQYFVFFPYETRRQCQLNWQQGSKAFYDPCYGQYYDLTGRAVDDVEGGVSVPEIAPLPIPKYQFSATGQLLIDARK